MKKLKKVIVSIAVCCAIVSGMGITANAATAFGFNLGTGGSDTSCATKYGVNTSATVNITSGSLSPSGWMRLYVTKNSSAVSTSVNATSLTSYTLYYTPTVPSGTVCLKGEAGYYSVSAAGTWTP